MQVNQKWVNVNIVTPNGQLRKNLLITDDHITAIIDPDTPTSSDWKVIDGGGNIVFPGMIDLLQHGFDLNFYTDPKAGCVANSSELLPAFGVTGFLPSIMSMPPNEMPQTLSELSRQCSEAQGARAIGVHSEGPCFSLAGAHNPKNLLLPSVPLADKMLEATLGKLKAVTIAPELDGAEAFIKHMKKSNVSVHLGHSAALPDNVTRYVSWGIDAVTHMYDALPSMPPDGTGVQVFSLPDALIAEPNLALGLICDGIHAHPKLVKLLAQLPSDRLFLETDSVKYAGREGARFEPYPGYWVTSAKGNAVRDENGLLCGSSLTSHEAMLNYMSFSGKSLTRASIATSLVPAKVLGMDHEIGSIETGKLADFIILDANTLSIKSTYVGGKLVYERN